MADNTYTFWYTQETTYKGYFMAGSREEAEELLNKLERGEIETSDLPDFDNSVKEDNLLVGLDTLEGDL